MEGFNVNYVFQDADIIVSSKEGVKFRVHSDILRRGSIIFRDMLTVGTPRQDNEEDVIKLEEPECVLLTLFNIIYPQCIIPFPGDLLDSIKLEEEELWFLRDIASAAVKYEMESVTRLLKKVCRDNERKAYSVILLYEISCNLGWEDEASHYASSILEDQIDILSSEVKNVLGRMASTRVLHLFEMKRAAEMKLYTDGLPRSFPPSRNMTPPPGHLQFS